MLYKAKMLTDFKLKCLDGEIGKVKELYFDDQHWTIRYLIVNTGDWLTGWKVLITPYLLTEVNNVEKFIIVDSTKKQIEASPSLNSDKPVSRQFEQAYYSYYGMPTYWSGPYMWGFYSYIEHDREKWKESVEGNKYGDPHLRSTQEVKGYHIQTSDGEIGHIEDFMIDEGTWAIRYLIIDTHTWWPGKRILISPQWIDRVSWEESKVFIKNLTRETIKHAPEYSEESLLNRDYEIELYKYYNRQGYWIDELAHKEHSS